MKNYFRIQLIIKPLLLLLPSILFMAMFIVGCVSTPETTTMETEEKPYVVSQESDVPITELEYIYKHCKGGLYTKTYTIDGQRYQIFWTGDGSEDGDLVVINLEEQAARIKYYEDNSNSY